AHRGGAAGPGGRGPPRGIHQAEPARLPPVTPAAPVRLAVVGVGHLGRHHARVAASLPGATLVGIHDHNGARADEIAREFGLRTLPDLEAVAREAEAAVI